MFFDSFLRINWKLKKQIELKITLFTTCFQICIFSWLHDFSIQIAKFIWQPCNFFCINLYQPSYDCSSIALATTYYQLLWTFTSCFPFSVPGSWITWQLWSWERIPRIPRTLVTAAPHDVVAIFWREKNPSKMYPTMRNQISVSASGLKKKGKQTLSHF